MRVSIWSGLFTALVTVGTAHAAPSLVNPGFDGDGTGVASAAGWSSVGSVKADFTEAGGESGAFRLSHWSSDDYSVETRQIVRGLSRGWYTLRARVKRSPGQNDSYVALDCDGRRERAYLPVAPADTWLTIVVSNEVRHGTCTVILHTAAAGGEWSNFDTLELTPGRAALSVLGADVSSLAKSEDLGGYYLDGSGRHQCRDGSALSILSRHGLNYVRLRAWVHPADGYHDTAELLHMAKRAKASGLKVLVDLHYSDTWADPGQQSKPAAWSRYSTEQLRKAVYDYTFDVCRRLKAQGTPADMVQLGNELNSGMLWPDGHTWDPPNWDNLAAFLKAGASAVKAASATTKVMLHLANGGDNGLYRWWFDNITARGVPFDVIGASFYSYWHGSLGDLQYNLNDVSARYGKDVIVAETGYPFTLDYDDDWANLIGTPDQLVSGYPATPEGQARNLRDVLAIVRAVPNHRGLGAFYWEATWTAVPGNGWDPADPASGNAWENQALFDFDYRALPALDVFRP